MDKEQLFRRLTNDTSLIEQWSKSLEEYDPVLSTDEPEMGIFTRYFDLREFPPVLKKGGILVDCTDTHYRFKSSHCSSRYWTLTRDFTMLFQKRTFSNSLIQMANQILKEKIGNQT